jgi:hypothetical protein
MSLSKHVTHYGPQFVLYYNLTTHIECANPIYNLLDLINVNLINI